HLAVAQVAVAAEVVVDGVQLDPGGAHDLEGLGHDLGTDAVASDHGDPVGQNSPLEMRNRPPGWTVARTPDVGVRYGMITTVAGTAVPSVARSGLRHIRFGRAAAG